MLDANIPDIALERDKTVKKVIKLKKQTNQIKILFLVTR
jgi:hypothetical protein